MYQREGKAAYKANLDNTHRLDAYFNHPHRSFPSIHVAGTNGKGSVSHMLASVLQEAGYLTGLYTSPHLLDFRERIRVNGRPVPEPFVTGFLADHQAIIKDVRPSFFEMTVAMAFKYFAEEKVDMAIIETGLGGRLDSTNIIQPLISVITNISMDHSEFLGSDLGSIAREKGGIIKENTPLVVGKVEKEIAALYQNMAREKKASITFSQEQRQPLFSTLNRDNQSILRIERRASGEIEEITCDLTGSYQQENVITTLATLETLETLKWNIPQESVLKGLARVSQNTGILGRWQTIGTNPRSICDTAHNQAGIEAVMNQVKQVPRKQLHVVWGLVSDKDLESILPLLPEEGIYYFTRSSVPRSMDAVLLQQRAEKFGLRGGAFHQVSAAYQAALSNAGSHDLVFTGGSTFVVADLLESLGY
jgi:dihydrofolate synthase/folylpolyglutamate synthase